MNSQQFLKHLNELNHSLDILLEATAQDVFNQYYTGKIPPEDFQKILEIDPTARIGDSLATSTKGKFTNWLANQYLKAANRETFFSDSLKNGLIAYSKLSNNKDGLEQLQATLSAPPQNLKDINSFTVDTIESLAPLATEEHLGKRKEQQIEVVFNDDNLFVCRPLTHEASRKFGTGTSWCTATSSSHWFDSYNKRGGLFIIINKKNTNQKWQYHDSSGYSFANKDDRLLQISKWYKQQIAANDDWAESVDQMAQVFEQTLPHGKEHWSLLALHQDMSQNSIEVLRKIISSVANLPPTERSYYLVDKELPLVAYAFYMLPVTDSLGVAEAFIDRLKIRVNATTVAKAFEFIHRAGSPRSERLFSFLNFVYGQDPEAIATAVSRYSRLLPIQELTKSMEILRFFLLTCKGLPLATKRRFVDGGPMSILTSDRLFRALQTEPDADESLKAILAEFFRDHLEVLKESRKLSEVRPAPTKASAVDLVFGGINTDEVEPELQTIINLLKQAYAPIKGGLPKTFKMLETLDFNEVGDYDTVEKSNALPMAQAIVETLVKVAYDGDPQWDQVVEAIQLEGKAKKFGSPKSKTPADWTEWLVTNAPVPILRKALAAIRKHPKFNEYTQTYAKQFVTPSIFLYSKYDPVKLDIHPFAIFFIFSASSLGDIVGESLRGTAIEGVAKAHIVEVAQEVTNRLREDIPKVADIILKDLLPTAIKMIDEEDRGIWSVGSALRGVFTKIFNGYNVRYSLSIPAHMCRVLGGDYGTTYVSQLYETAFGESSFPACKFRDIMPQDLWKKLIDIDDQIAQYVIDRKILFDEETPYKIDDPYMRPATGYFQSNKDQDVDAIVYAGWSKGNLSLKQFVDADHT
jgi:hypothetical protein